MLIGDELCEGVQQETDLDIANISIRLIEFLDDDPNNTVSIMLDGIESRLHIITIDVDLVSSIDRCLIDRSMGFGWI
jgi:hypothetical protein